MYKPSIWNHGALQLCFAPGSAERVYKFRALAPSVGGLPVSETASDHYQVWLSPKRNPNRYGVGSTPGVQPRSRDNNLVQKLIPTVTLVCLLQNFDSSQPAWGSTTVICSPYGTAMLERCVWVSIDFILFCFLFFFIMVNSFLFLS